MSMVSEFWKEKLQLRADWLQEKFVQTGSSFCWKQPHQPSPLLGQNDDVLLTEMLPVRTLPVFS